MSIFIIRLNQRGMMKIKDMIVDKIRKCSGFFVLMDFFALESTLSHVDYF